jgi:clan AA aspartic protease (TIGR02281 family)
VRRLVCVLLLAAAGGVPADEVWRHAGERDGASLYLDVSSIRRVAPGADLFRVRTQRVYRVPTPQGVAREVAQTLVSCDLNREFAGEVERFDAQGRSLGRKVPTEAEVAAAIERMRREPRIEYSARLAPLCAAIRAEVARGAGRVAGTAGASSIAGARSAPLVPGPGVWGVRARINGAVTTVMLVDSGASMVALTPANVRALQEAGVLSDADVVGEGRFTAADGRTRVAPVVRLRSIEIDGFAMRDVEASVLPAGDVPLLGQSFLGRLRHWSLNRETRTLDFVP